MAGIDVQVEGWSGALCCFKRAQLCSFAKDACVQAMVIWAANQDGISEMDSSAMGKAVSREAAALLMEASNEGAAARRLVAQMGATLAQRLPSMALLRLFLDLIEIPSVKQVRHVPH